MARLSYQDALDAVEAMETLKFSTRALAEKIGCTPENVRHHGWIEQLMEEGVIALVSEQSGPHPTMYRRARMPENKAKGLEYRDARGAARRLRHQQPFTQRELAEKLGCSEQNVSYRGWMDRLVVDGIVKYVGKRQDKGHAKEYEYIMPAEPRHIQRRKEDPPEKELIGTKEIHRTVGGTGKRRRKTTTREMQKLVEIAEAQGWTVERTKKNHLRFIPPNGGEHLIAPSTPSDWRSVKNTQAHLARCGIDFEGVAA